MSHARVAERARQLSAAGFTVRSDALIQWHDEGTDLMTASPVDALDTDDPVQILRVLPGEYHRQFLAEYEAAMDGARRPEEFRRLHDLLRLWRLRAIAYSGPGYEDRMASARDGSAGGFSPAEEVIPGWPHR